MQIKTALTTGRKLYFKRHSAFPIEYIEALQAEILKSSYLAASQLSDNFLKTKGFSVIFKRSGICQVEQEFPYLKPYLETALKSACNAFYLNTLVLEGNTYVESHVDCSLSEYGMEIITPNLVSVLYVQVPSDLQGGELVLQQSENELWHINPQVNMLLYFLGWLMHSVTPVQSSQQRISLICEQYNLTDEQLAKIPIFQIKSNAIKNIAFSNHIRYI